MPLDPLPIDEYMPAIAARLRERRALVLSAPPGAGKTTRVPPALAAAGPVLVLQPRRVAARAVARRIAGEQAWTLGREVGWHVRFERRFSPDTRVLLATEGILTARLQQDPLISEFRTVILDEFHERSIHADLGLALARQAWLARDDLNLLVMSATVQVGPVAAFLGGCPAMELPGAPHPLEIRHAPQAPIETAVLDALSSAPGTVLCFLPGAPEIRRAAAAVGRAAADRAEIVQLHGGLPADEQDAALRPASRRRVILATNIAETSLTVPDVRAVVDTGLQKVVRYDPARGLDSLVTERIAQDSAVQRAGRAARLGSGIVWRLWAASDRLRGRTEPEIHRVDLSGVVLDVLAWGGDPRTLEWYERPADAPLDAAWELLRRLGAVDGALLTPLGRRMQSLRVHPRLARILIAAGGSYDAALACAVLSERGTSPRAAEATTCDLLSAIARAPVAPHIERVARELQRLCGGGPAALDEVQFRRALLAGYPDRVGRRRASGSARVLLASGHGAVVGAESGVHGGEFILALDVTAARPGDGAEARIHLASTVEREWLQPDAVRVEHLVEDSSGRVRAVERGYYGALVISERPAHPDPEIAAALLTEAYLRQPPRAADESLVRRLRFCGFEVSLRDLVARAARGRSSVRDIDPAAALDQQMRGALARCAPERLPLPGGRNVRLEYQEDGSVLAQVKLQELFGVRETPRLGPRAEPVLLALLAPNGRPVQVTRDLRSFWDTTYTEVRKELRGRYPRHAWPEKP